MPDKAAGKLTENELQKSPGAPKEGAPGLK